LHQLQQHAQTAGERLLVMKLLEASNILEEQETVSHTARHDLLVRGCCFCPMGALQLLLWGSRHRRNRKQWFAWWCMHLKLSNAVVCGPVLV
jgi:hypothetical protein